MLCISIYFDRFISFLDICTFVRLSYFAEPSIYFLVMTVHSVRMGVRIRVVEIETSQHTVGMWKTPAESKLEMSRRGEGSVRGGEKMSGESERRQFRTVDGRHTATTTPASHRVRYDISRECRRTAAESTDKLSLAGGEARRGEARRRRRSAPVGCHGDERGGSCV